MNNTCKDNDPAFGPITERPGALDKTQKGHYPDSDILQKVVGMSHGKTIERFKVVTWKGQ